MSDNQPGLLFYLFATAASSGIVGWLLMEKLNTLERRISALEEAPSEGKTEEKQALPSPPHCPHMTVTRENATDGLTLAALKSSTEPSSLAEQCPAWCQLKCPFSPELKDKFQLCPVFKEGCPFKEDNKLADLFKHGKDLDSKFMKRLEECPAFSKGCPFAHAFEEEHELAELKKCPLFTSSCPFGVKLAGEMKC